jgi:hypothetical protein
VRDAVVFIGVAQEKAYAFSARRLPGKRAVFEFAPNKSVIPNYYYFYLDDAEWGESFNCAPKTGSTHHPSISTIQSRLKSRLICHGFALTKCLA